MVSGIIEFDMQHLSACRLALLASVAWACGSAPATAPSSPVEHPGQPALRFESESPIKLGPSGVSDPEVDAIVGRYRQALGQRLSKVLIETEADITSDGEPSSPLGQLVADVLLEELRHRSDLPVDCFITNDGGLRAPLYEGTVELRHVYEVMPFNNELVIVEVDAVKLQAIADAIAAHRGEPVAALRMRIDVGTKQAHELEIGGKPLDPTAAYRVGTSDYLARSGWMSEIVADQPMVSTGYLMREAIAEGLLKRARAGGRLAPRVDDRIRMNTEPTPAKGSKNTGREGP